MPWSAAISLEAESTCNCDCDTIAHQDCSGGRDVDAAFHLMDAKVACYIHDHCYSMQSDKSACDKNFRHNVMNLCRISPKLVDWFKDIFCPVIAQTAYKLVRDHGTLHPKHGRVCPCNFSVSG